MSMGENWLAPQPTANIATATRCQDRTGTSGTLRRRDGSAHADEIDDEDQGLVGTDDAARAALAVGEHGRDGDAPAAAHAHPGHALVPARDDLALAEAELERAAAVPRCV